MVEPVWRRRLRWRLRGAWQWPVFAVLTVVDAVLVARLPFSGEGTDAIGAFLFAGFVNLIVVAVLAPFAGMALRRRRRDLPFMIARDYAGTALLSLFTVCLVAGGLLHRSALAAEHRDERAVYAAVHRYLEANEPAFAPYLRSLDMRLLEDESYRACVFRPREKLPICFFVNTNQSPAGIKRDPTRHVN
jgi:hypothetical protein